MKSKRTAGKIKSEASSPSRLSEFQRAQREKLGALFEQCPLPTKEMLRNLGLFLNGRDLKRILFMNDLYQRILRTNGVIMEFGTRWGQNLALFSSLRNTYEPYNLYRKIIGFDTFTGFQSLSAKDGRHSVIKPGNFSVSEGYEDYLTELLNYHDTESPLPHIKKTQICKGGAPEQLRGYLREHPETIIALAYFDFDLYQPTRQCLELILDHVTVGTVLGFDELNIAEYPGETLALKEVLGLRRWAIERSPYSHSESFVVVR